MVLLELHQFGRNLLTLFLVIHIMADLKGPAAGLFALNDIHPFFVPYGVRIDDDQFVVRVKFPFTDAECSVLTAS